VLVEFLTGVSDTMRASGGVFFLGIPYAGGFPRHDEFRPLEGGLGERSCGWALKYCIPGDFV